MLNSLANSLLWGWRKRLQKSIQLSLFYKLTVRWLRNNKFPLNCSFMLNLYSTIWENIHRSWWIFYYYLGKSLYECVILTIQKKQQGQLNGLMVQKRTWIKLDLLSDFLCSLSMVFRQHHTSVLNIFSIFPINQIICLYVFVFFFSWVMYWTTFVVCQNFSDHLIEKHKTI